MLTLRRIDLFLVRLVAHVIFHVYITRCLYYFVVSSDAARTAYRFAPDSFAFLMLFSCSFPPVTHPVPSLYFALHLLTSMPEHIIVSLHQFVRKSWIFAFASVILTSMRYTRLRNSNSVPSSPLNDIYVLLYFQFATSSGQCASRKGSHVRARCMHTEQLQLLK